MFSLLKLICTELFLCLQANHYASTKNRPLIMHCEFRRIVFMITSKSLHKYEKIGPGGGVVQYQSDGTNKHVDSAPSNLSYYCMTKQQIFLVGSVVLFAGSCRPARNNRECSGRTSCGHFQSSLSSQASGLKKTAFQTPP